MRLLIFFIVNLLICNSSLNAQSVSEKEIKEEFRKEVRERLALLQSYIKTVGDKTRSDHIRLNALEAALDLFSPTAKMEVSNKYTGKIKTYQMREYFQHLMDLPYKYVEITFKEPKVSEVWQKSYKASPTSEVMLKKYKVKGTYFQLFTGKGNTQKKDYSDYTIKELDVDIKEILDLYGSRWVVIFQNIKVLKTK